MCERMLRWSSVCWSVVARRACPRTARHDLRPAGLGSCGLWALIVILAAPAMSRAETTPAAAARPASAAATTVAEEEDPNVKTARKLVEGTVNSMTKRSLAVEYEVDGQPGYEISLPLDKDTVWQRVQSPSDLKYGDVVQVEFEQKYRMDPDKTEPWILKTTAKVVRLIRQGSRQDLTSREQ